MTCITVKIKDSGNVILYLTTDGSEINIHTLDEEHMVEIE